MQYEEVKQRILQIMRDRGLPNNPDNFRMIAAEMGRRGAKVRAARAAQAKKQKRPLATKPTSPKNDKANSGQSEFNFPESFQSKINYILKDLLF